MPNWTRTKLARLRDLNINDNNNQQTARFWLESFKRTIRIREMVRLCDDVYVQGGLSWDKQFSHLRIVKSDAILEATGADDE